MDIELSALGRTWHASPGEELLIGRDPSCPVHIPANDVSRRHARVFFDGQGWVLEDLHSANGIYVNGQRMPNVVISAPVSVTLGAYPTAPQIQLNLAFPTAQPSPAPAAPYQGSAAQPSAAPQGPGQQGPTHQAPATQGPAPQPSPFPMSPQSPAPASGSRGKGQHSSTMSSPTMSSPTSMPPTLPGTPPRAQQIVPRAVPQLTRMAPGAAPDQLAQWAGEVQQVSRTQLGKTITIGRERDNSIVLPDFMVSRHHARLVQQGASFLVMDLGSSNGTFINGRPVRQGVMNPGDVLSIGQSQFAIDGEELVQAVESTRVSFSAEHISFVLPNGRKLLDDISFDLGPSSLTAVIGPSGAGKSTLLRVLTGRALPATGRVHFNGRDLHADYGTVSQRLGLVPQDDVIHRQLSVQKALNYAAELRFPDDLDKNSRAQRVTETMAELGLTQHAGTQVSRLSGGQRKRTSVAMELLTRPSLLFLDEPTSGLDPGLDKSVMKTLRGLADGDRTVLVVTHSVANLSLCDNVLLLAPGGKVAYFGPPEHFLPFFNATDPADIFEAVAAEPDLSKQRFAMSPLAPRGNAPQQPPPVEEGYQRRPRHSAIKQMAVLVRRHIRVMFSDRSYMMFNFALPIVLALLALAVEGSRGLGPAPKLPDLPTAEPNQLLVIMAIGAAFMGTSASASELVGERPIHVREANVGLKSISYLMSKLIVFGILTAVESGILTLLVLIFKKAPENALIFGNPSLELGIEMIITANVCMVLGLLISSFVTTQDQVMPLLVVSVMAQLVLCGGFIPVAGRAVLEQLSWFTPLRWGYAMMGATSDISAIALGVKKDDLWKHETGAWWLSYGVICAQALVMIVMIYIRLRMVRKKS